jgi:hypothetical protein
MNDFLFYFICLFLKENMKTRKDQKNDLNLDCFPLQNYLIWT